MKKTSRLCMLSLGGLLCAALSAPAVSNEMRPGLWEHRVKFEMPGMPMMPGGMETTFRKCYTAEELKRDEQYRPDKSNPEWRDCKISDLKQSKGKASYRFSCKHDGGRIEGSAEAEFGRDKGRMVMRTKMSPPVEGMSEMRYVMDWKRVGDCPK